MGFLPKFQSQLHRSIRFVAWVVVLLMISNVQERVHLFVSEHTTYTCHVEIFYDDSLIQFNVYLHLVLRQVRIDETVFDSSYHRVLSFLRFWVKHFLNCWKSERLSSHIFFNLLYRFTPSLFRAHFEINCQLITELQVQISVIHFFRKVEGFRMEICELLSTKDVGGTQFTLEIRILAFFT